MERQPKRVHSVLDTDPSEAGAARVGGSASATERIKRDARDFVRLGRSLVEDFRAGRLTFNEYGLLVYLWSRANAFNAMFLVSYSALAEESRGQFDTNDINKRFLSLRENRYIWFKKRPGRRGPTEICINYYPLAEGGFTDLGELFQTGADIRSISDVVKNLDVSLEVETEVLPEVKPEVSPEVPSFPQSSRDEIKRLVAIFSPHNATAPSRGSYNDSEKEKENKKDSSVPLREKIKYDPNRPTPISAEEQRAREIADALGEPDYVYVTAKLTQYDIDVLDYAYRVAVTEQKKGGVISLGALFNSLVEKFGQKKYGKQGSETQP